ncbi:MAG: DUF4245 domain-containing protein [Nocardioidaceae bacterium]
MSEQPGKYQRSVSGLIGALAVLLVVIGVVAALQALNRPHRPDPVQPVDYRTPAKYAAKQARFDLLVPPSLPAGWTATTVRFTGGADQHWHLGCLDQDGHYVGLEQGEQSVRSLVSTYVDEAARRGRPVTVSGNRWDTWTDDGGDLALVRRTGRAGTLVVGHLVPRAALVAFVQSLR